MIKTMEYSKLLLGFRKVLNYLFLYDFATEISCWQFFEGVFCLAFEKNSFYMINDAVKQEHGYVRDRNKASKLGLDGCKKGRYCKWRIQTPYHLRETGQSIMQEKGFSGFS